MIQILIGYNAPMDKRDFQGRTPLSFVIKNIKKYFDEIKMSNNYSKKTQVSEREKIHLRNKLEKAYEIMSVIQ